MKIKPIAFFIFCVLLVGRLLSAAEPNTGPALNLPWDWSGVIGTGQSLSVGARAWPIESANQSRSNLKLFTDKLPWPIDPNNTHLSMVPLVEPVGRIAPNYPSSWPENIDGETYHTAMADEMSALVLTASGRDFIAVHSEVGEDGQCMIYLNKNAPQNGVNGHSYEAALIETKAIARLAKAVGKIYGVGAIVVSHGECDVDNADYQNELYQLWLDYNTDLKAITGQQQTIQMIVSQQNSVKDRSLSTLAQWKIGLDHPAEIVCSGPKYQYPYFTDSVHLTADGYRQLGEKYGQVYYERVILGRNWQPLQPTTVERNGAVLTIHFHVPVPPLVWETSFEAPHRSADEWKLGKGFEVSTSAGVKVVINSVNISGDAVIITCASDPGSKALVAYAMMGGVSPMMTPYRGTFRWGLLRDSDPFVGAFTKKPQPNYSLAFELTAQ